jgi:6-pyruvoyltetrahydropterin/6-carboxytetrahydropterin synthase
LHCRPAMNMADFHIRIANDDLVFSAAHFITLEGGACERLHGHTYRVAAEVFGPLDDCQCVVDFQVVRGALKSIVAELDHRVLLPAQHATIRVSSKAGEVEAIFADRRWVFPQDDCLLLPIANTTTESLAHYVATRLAAAIKSSCGSSPNRVQIEISEGTGCAAICDSRC